MKLATALKSLGLAAAVTCVVTLAIPAPASAARPLPVGSIGAQTLEFYCNQVGGSFEYFSSGDYWCVLPDGQVILCFNRTGSCHLFYRVTPTTPTKPVSPRSGILSR